MEKNNYFSSPVYFEKKPEWVKKLNTLSDEYLKKIKKTEEVYHSNNLALEKEMAFFSSYVGEKSYLILKEQGYDLNNHHIAMTSLWVQDLKKGGYHCGHVHSNNHISGFYFLKGSDKSSFPVFHDPRAAKLITDLPLKDETQISDGSPSFHIKPKPGDLVIFNSYLNHEFSLNRDKNTYRFIHFNIQAIPRTNV
tara:strand:- start:893 stop:1474 length:582 start_codon:yes stop_codon:yes gene_type:complete